MKTSEKQELKKKLKRIGLFLLIVLIPCLVVCVLLMWAKVSQWLNVLILVIMLFFLFPLYSWVWMKIDQRKEERLSKKKDPFSE